MDARKRRHPGQGFLTDMMPAIHPGRAAFVRLIAPELILAQVLIRRREGSFELRHVDDRQQPGEALRTLAVSELRAWSQFTATGDFRPLRAAPNLRPGWVCQVSRVDELESALAHLYPGAVADWFAAQGGRPPVTSYRAMAERQTGRYRGLARVTDEEAARMATVCCDRSFCLKRRRWRVGNLNEEAAADKSLIPCLEPCAVLMEFARGMAGLSPREILDSADAEASKPHDPPAQVREADFGSPANPRRRRWVEAWKTRLSNPAPGTQ